MDSTLTYTVKALSRPFGTTFTGLTARLIFGGVLVTGMAALDLSNIPSNINSYERLFVWAGQCLQSIANGQTSSVIEGQGAQPTAQVQVGVIADNTDRFIVSGYVPMDRDALNDADNKTWMAANDISESAPNANLLTN